MEFEDWKMVQKVSAADSGRMLLFLPADAQEAILPSAQAFEGLVEDAAERSGVALMRLSASAAAAAGDDMPDWADRPAVVVLEAGVPTGVYGPAAAEALYSVLGCGYESAQDPEEDLFQDDSETSAETSTEVAAVKRDSVEEESVVAVRKSEPPAPAKETARPFATPAPKAASSWKSILSKKWRAYTYPFSWSTVQSIVSFTVIVLLMRRFHFVLDVPNR